MMMKRIARQASAVLCVAPPVCVLIGIGIVGYALLRVGPAAMLLITSSVLTLAGERRPAQVPVRRRSF